MRAPRIRRSAPAPETIPPLSMKGNMLWNSAGSLTYLACQWLVTVLVVRLSSGGYDAAGLLALAMSVVGLFGTLANYKMGTYQISDVNRENDLSEYLGFRIVMLVASFVLCMVYAYATCSWYTLPTVALFYCFKAVGLVIDVLHGTDQQHRRLDYAGMSFILQGVSTLAAFSAVFYLTQNLDLAIVAMGVAAFSVLVFWDIPRTSRFEPVRIRFTGDKMLFFLKTSFPATLAALAAGSLFVVPKQMLSCLSGDAALGVYSSVAALALVVQMGANYLYGPLLDVFPALYFGGKRAKFLKLFARTALGIVGVAAVCSVALALVGAWLLEFLFGESILPYVYLLQPILAATLATAFLWFFGDLLIALRDFRGNLIGNLVAFASVAAFSYPFVRIWDMNGVSFAGMAACALGAGVLLLFIVRKLRKFPAGSEEGR